MQHIEPYSDSEIDIATDQAMVTLLWSAGDRCDEEGNSLYPWDSKFSVSDFAPNQRVKMRELIAAFMTANLEALVRSGHTADAWGNIDKIEQIGHDYVLTTGGHGVGFWDRGLGELGDKLSDVCRAESHEWSLFTGEEHVDGIPGKLYCDELER